MLGNVNSRRFALIFAALASFLVKAEEGRTVNGINIQTGVGVQVGHNDNLLRVASSSEDKVATGFAILTPQVRFAISPKDHRFIVKYKLQAGEYFSSKADNYVDHDFASNNLVRLSLRNAIRLDINYRHQHEVRGDGLSEGDSDVYAEPLKYEDMRVRATYIYGAPAAQGKLSLFTEWAKKEYQNYRNLDDFDASYSTRFNDFDDVSAGIEFINAWRRNAKLVLSYRYSGKSYDEQRTGVLNKDSKNDILYAGLDWDLVQKTNGYLRLGIQNKNFQDGRREDFTGFSWRIGANWKPVQYSNVRLETSQITKDPDQDGDYLRQTIYALGWRHHWHSQVYSNIGVSYTQDDYTGAFQNGVLRDDDITKYTFAVGYQYNRNVDTSLHWWVINKNSSWNTYGYDQNVWSLNIKFKF